MPANTQDPYETTRLIRTGLDCIIDKPSLAKSELPKLRRLAARLDNEIDHEVRNAERRGSEPRKKPKKAVRVIGYAIEEGRFGPAIAEHRSGNAAPFRCPKDIFELVAQAMDNGPEVQRFSDIYEYVESQIDYQLPDYQARVAIRFLAHRRIVDHARARFSRTGKSKITSAANKAWKDLVKATNAGKTPI
jgi:hypothetical protein